MTSILSTRHSKVAALLLAFTMSVGTVWGQTKITAPPNKYSVQEDVKLGREAADEARKQLPLLDDNRVDDYVGDVGQRLVASIPPEFRQPAFEYSFDVVNMKDINAFALPGGPMFVNRGMIEAARSEGEMAGVMAHELSHVLLRHGTAQASAGQKYQIGAIAGQILGAIVGGGLGSVIAQGSNFGLSTMFLKYGREYERQADILGAQLMARAGYDPRQMASMFQTIEKEGGRSGPEWMSSHPNPGNRAAYITKEAQALRVEGSRGETGQFAQIKSRLGGMSPALTSEQVARSQQTGQGQGRPPSGRTVRVAAPSAQFRTVTASNLLRMDVPSNWRDVSGGNTIMFAPDGALFESESGGSVFTHGVQVGVARSQTGNLQRDTTALIQGFARTNPQLRQASGLRRVNIGGRNGLTTTLRNVSEVTGQNELVAVSTVPLRDGNMLYLLGVVPENEAGAYDEAFARIRQSMRLAD